MTDPVNDQTLTEIVIKSVLPMAATAALLADQVRSLLDHLPSTSALSGADASAPIAGTRLTVGDVLAFRSLAQTVDGLASADNRAVAILVTKAAKMR